jgi:hypothetical protein
MAYVPLHHPATTDRFTTIHSFGDHRIGEHDYRGNVDMDLAKLI